MKLSPRTAKIATAVLHVLALVLIWYIVKDKLDVIQQGGILIGLMMLTTRFAGAGSFNVVEITIGTDAKDVKVVIDGVEQPLEKKS